MSGIRCKLNIVSLSAHISQIITGFLMLKKAKIIDLEIDYSPRNFNLYPPIQMVEAIIDNKIKVAYDMEDGYHFNQLKQQDIEKYLRGVDFYFKRSYNIENHKHFENFERIHPLGFNYHVTTANNIVDRRITSYDLVKVALFIRNAWYCMRKKFHVESFEDIPRYNNETLVLFLTRVWDPEVQGEFLDEKMKEEREYINRVRADCIIKLRKEFGENFIGGLTPTAFAKKHYPALIVEKAITRRSNYLRLIRNASTCVATMGLHESNGWKLAEYIAASKSIVSEKLRHTVPGNFNCIDNYLEFTDADQCVDQVTKLEDDKMLAYNMRVNNYIYYHNYLRPDRLVYNTLAFMLKEKAGIASGENLSDVIY